MTIPERPKTHPHPAPGKGPGDHDVLVVGGGHAGIEAALAAARLGVRVGLVSLRLDRIGEMSCNPAIGGLGKGQIVREVDALGGVMGRVADATGIQFRMLNTAKGAAVQAPRCQSDRHRYRECATDFVRGTEGVELIEGAAEDLVFAADGRTVVGLELADGRRLSASAVILTTGTFLRAVMHMGEEQSAGGRVGEGTTSGLSASMDRLAIELGRLKTGTPPRLAAESIDWEELEEQPGDSDPLPFSHYTSLDAFPVLRQVPCHLTWTGPAAHALVAANIHRAPMYAGRIKGVGPRYCPSIEDKVMRFADRDRHQVFLEPEGLDTNVIYVNGVSTSLPAEIQEQVLRTIPGLERCEFLRHGYAVEYDFVAPFQLDPTFALRKVPGLFLAGQINGTSGYEEAAGQGLMAGANAALWIKDQAPFLLARHEAYIGVLVDDLVVANPTEPYRMFTSRAEHRLLLRQDNADRRLVRPAHRIGLVGDAALAKLEAREARLGAARTLLEAERLTAYDGKSAAEVLKRPELKLADLADLSPAVASLGLGRLDTEALETEIKYEGYVRRQEDSVRRMRSQESREIPTELDFQAVKGLGGEAREKLSALRPRTLGQAGRIAGVRPPDVALLAVAVERLHRERSAH